MTDATATIATVDPSRALADLGEPNKPTKTIPPPAAPAGKLVDKLGTPFDDAQHSRDRHGNPMMRADGGWCLKRGNGARKLAGKPPAGAVGYVSVAPKPDAAPTGTPPAGGSAPSPGAAGSVVDGVPVDGVPMLTEADFEGTALGLTNGGFSLMQLVFGKAWEPDDQERRTWVGALRRLWYHYQLPRVGPLIEVLLLIPATIAKRRHDARTLEGWAKVKAWMGVKPKAKPKPDDATPAATDAKAA